MNHLNVKVIVEGFLGIVFVSFVLKLFLITTAGSFLINLTGNDQVAVCSSIVLSIGITGYIVGLVLSKKAKAIPLWHALIVGGLGGAYKLARPDFEPLPMVLVLTFSLLYMVSVVASVYANTRKT